MSGTGTTTARGGLTIGGTAANSVFSVDLLCTLNNLGTAQIVQNGSSNGYTTTFYIGSTGTFDNKPGASFAFSTDGTSIAAPAAQGGTFLNEGILTKESSQRPATAAPAPSAVESPSMTPAAPR
jgi:hypothetical protein